MDSERVMDQWQADREPRYRELLLSLTGNPRERVAVSVDDLAVLVLLAKRSAAWLDYGFEAKLAFEEVVDRCLCQCDERAHEVIENHQADYEAHIAEWTAARTK